MPLNFDAFRLESGKFTYQQESALPCGKECHTPEKRQVLVMYVKVPNSSLARDWGFGYISSLGIISHM